MKERILGILYALWKLAILVVAAAGAGAVGWLLEPFRGQLHSAGPPPPTIFTFGLVGGAIFTLAYLMIFRHYTDRERTVMMELGIPVVVVIRLALAGAGGALVGSIGWVGEQLVGPLSMTFWNIVLQYAAGALVAVGLVASLIIGLVSWARRA